jgi:hypothetical protein
MLIDTDGIVTRWPKKVTERQEVLQYLSEKFAQGKVYKEAEVNEILRAFHSFSDWALLRRELFESGKLDRNPRTGDYWKPDTK